jgi:hypothetical protein
MIVTFSDSSVGYKVKDFSDPDQPQTIGVHLTFDGPDICGYFLYKLEEGLRSNAALNNSGPIPVFRPADVRIRAGSGGLAYVLPQSVVNTFSFVVGGERYQCSSAMADFLAPRVSELCGSDATVAELALDVDDPDNFFAQFLKLGDGEEIEVGMSKRPLFDASCQQLWNSELYERLLDADEGSLDQLLSQIDALVGQHCDCSRELDFVAGHFHEIEDLHGSLSKFEPALIYEIISRPSLKLVTQDSLFQFLIERTRANPTFFRLFDSVRLEWVSGSMIIDLLSVIEDLELWDELDLGIWKSVERRFTVVGNEGTFAFSSDEALNGIIAHLTRHCGGNVHQEGVVAITASSHMGGNKPHNVADLTANSRYLSLDAQGPNQWVCYDFKDARVRVTHYSIRTFSGPGCFPREWVVDASTDGKSWTEVDRRPQNTDLNVPGVTKGIPVTRSLEARMIRLRGTGTNHKGGNALEIAAFELFGAIHHKHELP